MNNDNKELPLCPLYFPFGHCPICIEDVEEGDYALSQMKESNNLCCKSHRQPTDEEVKEMFGGNKS